MCGTILWYWYVNYMPNQTCGTTKRVDLKAELTLFKYVEKSSDTL